jgi:arylsulfatase A-like enzyme
MIKTTGRTTHAAVSATPAISPDLYPTILDLADLPAQPEQHRDGVSLAGIVRGGKPPARDALYWHFPHYSNHGMQSPGGAIRQGDFKLLDYFENNTVQLFNLRDDPGEQHDLAQTQPKKAAELQAKLQAWRKEVGAQMPPPNPNYDGTVEYIPPPASAKSAKKKQADHD